MEDEQKQKKQPRARRNFTDEFKASAVAHVRKGGKSVTRVAKDLDLTPSALGKWVEQARADAGKSARGTLTTEEKEELARLLKEVRGAEMTGWRDFKSIATWMQAYSWMCV